MPDRLLCRPIVLPLLSMVENTLKGDEYDDDQPEHRHGGLVPAEVDVHHNRDQRSHNHSSDA